MLVWPRWRVLRTGSDSIEQGDRDGHGEQRRTPADRRGQGAGGDDTEGGHQEQGAEGPRDAEGLPRPTR